MPTDQNSSPGFFKTIKDAIHGTERDLTKGPLSSAIISLAIPMVLEVIMESIFALVDVFFVSKLGANAVATVGLTESMISMVYTVAMGLGMGATVVVSRRIGENNSEGAAEAAVQTLILGVIFAAILGTLGILFAADLLALMGASQEVILLGSSYTRIMLGGNIVILALFLINGIFRGAGDAAIAMRVLWVANIVNIILCPCFIYGLGPFPELGLTGAAVATTCGRGFGALYALSRLFRAGGRIQIFARQIKIIPEIILKILSLSATAALQMFIATASWVGLTRIISTFGSEALAGYTIGIRIILFGIFPSWGLSNAAATMVGQALGAKDPDRAEKAVWLTCFYNLIFMGTLGVIFMVFANHIVGFFTQDPHIIPHAVGALRTMSYGFFFYAYGMVLSQAFNGAGDTWTPTFINFFVFWCGEFPISYLLAIPLGFGPPGVFWGMTIAFSSLALVTAIVFRRGKWKLKVV